MIHFANEGEFKKYLMDTLQARGCNVIPIQTRTRDGVPDLSVDHISGHRWIEVKQLLTKNFDEMQFYYKIPFRPGQQKVAFEIYVATKKPVLCCVAFKNGMYFFEQRRIYPDGRVRVGDFKELNITKEGLIL